MLPPKKKCFYLTIWGWDPLMNLPTLEIQMIDQAELLMREGAFEKAKLLLSKIILEDPANLRAICDIGIAYTETGENEKAIRALLHYISNDDSNPYAWEALGCARFRTGDINLSMQNLRRSLALFPHNASALRNLGILHNIVGEKIDGLRLLQKSIRLAPHDYRNHYALNHAYRDLGKNEEREKILERLLEFELPEAVRRDVVISRIRMTLDWD